MGELSHEKSLMHAPRKEPVLRGPDLSGQALGRGPWGPARAICPRATHSQVGKERGRAPGFENSSPFLRERGSGIHFEPPLSPSSPLCPSATNPETGNNSPTSCATQPPSHTAEGQARLQGSKMAAPRQGYLKPITANGLPWRSSSSLPRRGVGHGVCVWGGH